VSMQPPGQPVQATGKVISVVDGTGQDAQGNWAQGRRVTYQLSSGHTGTVFVPLAAFSAESVRAAIAADAQKLADVANLTF
jgi:hypothetical protein